MNSVVNQIMPKIVDNIVIPLVELLFAVAILYFVYGLFGFFVGGDNAEKRKEGQNHILYGVIGIAIMVSVYGIIRFVASSLGQSAPL